jgi:hypothetical protein
MSTPKAKKTIAGLRAAHDMSVVVPNRIRGLLAALVASGDEWAYEKDFLVLTNPGVNALMLAKHREEFSDYWAELAITKKSSASRVWFANKKLADKWKETQSG